MKQFSNGVVASGSTECRCNRIHSRSSEVRVFILTQSINYTIGVFESSVHDKRNTNRQTTQNLFVLRFLRVLQGEKKCL